MAAGAPLQDIQRLRHDLHRLYKRAKSEASSRRILHEVSIQLPERLREHLTAVRDRQMRPNGFLPAHPEARRIALRLPSDQELANVITPDVFRVPLQRLSPLHGRAGGIFRYAKTGVLQRTTCSIGAERIEILHLVLSLAGGMISEALHAEHARRVHTRS